ncbi:hypothetical protein HNR63_000231 [Anoxybacillus kamchatkensis]|uniref:O-antigen ligase family protein n=1 Tax=Anoxybacillus ayderensis TaxID=265546 RepID=UPI0015EB744C|nr:O-antigen ligase family protein [Anoxybacillus ayderensis]MBA2877204.1 hypothetical protein [Anoxybacillus ayderensis]
MAFIVYFFFIIAIFSFGLYDNIYSFALAICALCILLLLYTLIRRERVIFPVFLFPIPFFYLFPLLFHVETTQGTIDQLIVWISCIAFITLFLFTKNKQEVITWISWTVIVATYVILVRIISFPDFILSVSQEVSGLGKRLSGFFQYPNAFASLLGSLLLFHLGYAVKEKKQTVSLLHRCAILPLWTLFLLTESRGAWVIFFLAWLVSFYVVPKHQHFMYTTLSIFSFIGGTIIYALMTINGDIHFSFLSACMLIFFILLIWMWEKRGVNIKFPTVRSLHTFPSSLFTIAILLIADLYFKGFIYRMLPVALQRRFSFDIGTLTERVLYWQDAWKEWESFIWIGLGGKAWKILMYRVQSFPYLSGELHNGYLNLIVEIGMVGTLYVLFLVLYASQNLWKQRAIELVPFIFLILHAVIEFTFSFPVLIMLTIMLAISGMNKSHSFKFTSIQTTFSFFMFTMCIILCFLFIKAEQTFVAAQYASTKEEARALTIKAMKQNKWNITYVLFAVENKLLSVKEEQQALKNALTYEPNHSLLLFYAGKNAEKQQNIEQAATYYERSLATDRFDINKYTFLIDFYLKRLKETNGDEAYLWGEKAKKTKERMEILKQQVKKQKWNDQRNFLK